jgi:hypothetical protein
MEPFDCAEDRLREIQGSARQRKAPETEIERGGVGFVSRLWLWLTLSLSLSLYLSPSRAGSAHPTHFRLTRLAVTQQLARVSARTLAVLKGHLTIDHDPAIPLRPLHPPPIIRRHIVHDLPR